MMHDPVCGVSINPKQSEWLLVRAGESIHFCCRECRQEFIGQERLQAAVAGGEVQPSFQTIAEPVLATQSQELAIAA